MQHYAEASLAVFRDGWGDKDFWSALRTVPPQSTCRWSHRTTIGCTCSVVAGGQRILTDTGSLVLDDRRADYFNSPLAHNVVVIRNAEPVPLPQGAGQQGALFKIGDKTTWVRAGSRAWKKDEHLIWHRRDVIFDPIHQCLAIC